MNIRLLVFGIVVIGFLLLVPPPVSIAVVPVVQTYSDGTDGDQDDMCVWVHPTNPALSTIISSDKENGTIYVYDLDGSVIQSFASPQPGNIDVRYGFGLGTSCVDLVALNERTEKKIRVYRVDPATRHLVRVDDGAIATPTGNYGFTLYRHADGRLFAHTGPDGSGSVISQYELVDNGGGQVAGAATGWQFDETTVEGMVGDDETGYIYLTEESGGVWRVSALDDTDKTLIAAVGDASGLTADVEGIAIYHAAGGTGYIIASSQGADKYTVLDRRPPHTPIGEFTLAGVGNSDGIDVLNLALGSQFPTGIFAVHNGADCCPIQAAHWSAVAADLPGLVVDTQSWDPRASNRNCEISSTTTLTPPTTTTLPLACAQPLSAGTAPVATDCLHILRVVVGLATCDPVCVCAPKGTLPVSATDALMCLNKATGQPIALNCPC
jgi:3-phytase